MTRIVVERLVGLIIVLLIVSIVVFLMVALIPGDPVEHMTGVHVPREVIDQLRAKYGLDQPVFVRYVKWLQRVVQGDFGITVAGRLPVTSLIGKAFPVSLELSMLSMLVACVVAFPMGIFAAVRMHSLWDRTVMFLGIALGSFPGYILGLLFLLLFSVKLGVLPAGGYKSFTQEPLGNLLHMLMPSLAMGLYLAGGLARFIRSGMIDVLGKEYIRVARAKGVGERTVLIKHAARNALVPIMTFLGLQLGEILGGAIITETIFVLPGLGMLGLRAILSREFVLIQGIVLIIAAWYTLLNFLVDMLVIYINPKIRYS